MLRREILKEIIAIAFLLIPGIVMIVKPEVVCILVAIIAEIVFLIYGRG